VCAFFHAIL